MRLAVVIVSWNTCEWLERCLRALILAEPLLDLEVVVVDNASADRSAGMVQEKFPVVRLVANRENKGFAVAVNQGLALAQAPFWCLLNPDAEILPGALTRLLQTLEAHPEAAAVGPQLIFPDGRLQPSGRRFPALWRTLADGCLPSAWRASRVWQWAIYGRADFSRPAVVHEVSGACFIARRAALERCGFFDERFFVYFEEVDWFRRVADQGFQVRYEPAARVIHRLGAAAKSADAGGVLLAYAALVAYWGKHRGWMGQAGARIVTAIHAGVRYAAAWGCRAPGCNRSEQRRLAKRLLALACSPLPAAYRIKPRPAAEGADT